MQSGGRGEHNSIEEDLECVSTVLLNILRSTKVDYNPDFRGSYRKKRSTKLKRDLARKLAPSAGLVSEKRKNERLVYSVSTFAPLQRNNTYY